MVHNGDIEFFKYRHLWRDMAQQSFLATVDSLAILFSPQPERLSKHTTELIQDLICPLYERRHVLQPDWLCSSCCRQTFSLLTWVRKALKATSFRAAVVYLTLTIYFPVKWAGTQPGGSERLSSAEQQQHWSFTQTTSFSQVNNAEADKHCYITTEALLG